MLCIASEHTTGSIEGGFRKQTRRMGAAKKAPAKAVDPKAALAKSKADAQGFKCVKCMQTFSATAKRQQLEQHIVTKHDDKKNKATFEECFGADCTAKA